MSLNLHHLIILKNKKKVILEINLQINTINEKLLRIYKEQLDKNKLTQDELIKSRRARKNIWKKTWFKKRRIG